MLAICLGVFSLGLVVPVLANPIDGEINVQGTVPASPPSQPAVINQPVNGQHFTTSPITVIGTCTGNTTIEIYKNNVFAGSGSCQGNGTFSINIDLFFGKNILIAKIKDSLGQYGPDSAPVEVSYRPITPQPIPSGGGGAQTTPSDVAQLLLQIDTDYRGIFPGDPFEIEPSVIGGVPPYAIKIDWGDDTEDIIALKSNGPFLASHVFKTPGTRIIRIFASDNIGQKAYIQTVAVVNGPVDEKEDSRPSIIDRVEGLPWWLWLIIFLILVLIGILLGLYINHRRHKRQQNPPSDQHLSN